MQVAQEHVTGPHHLRQGQLQGQGSTELELGQETGQELPGSNVRGLLFSRWLWVQEAGHSRAQPGRSWSSRVRQTPLALSPVEDTASTC